MRVVCVYVVCLHYCAYFVCGACVVLSYMSCFSYVSCSLVCDSLVRVQLPLFVTLTLSLWLCMSVICNRIRLFSPGVCVLSVISSHSVFI